MKKIKYVWENQGFRHIDDGQCDFVKIIVTLRKVVMEYGNARCVIKENFPWVSRESSIDEAFNILKSFQTSQDLGVTMCDGYNETLGVDSKIVLSHVAETELIKSVVETINRLVGFDVHEYGATRFALLKPTSTHLRE
jgi:hypothetical protein